MYLRFMIFPLMGAKIRLESVRWLIDNSPSAPNQGEILAQVEFDIERSRCPSRDDGFVVSGVQGVS